MVHIGPSRVPVRPFSSCRFAFKPLPVALRPGSTPMITAASTASPRAYITVAIDRSKSIQNGTVPFERSERLHAAERDLRQHQPGGRANDRQRKRFDEQLREDAATARAERRAHGDLAEARHGAGVDENREVHGDDERERADEKLSDAHHPHPGRMR